MTHYIGNNIFDYSGVVPSTPEECLKFLSTQSVIGIDIETTRKYPKGQYIEKVYKAGLDPRLSKIVMVQVGTLEERYIIDARAVDCSFLVPILENPNILKVGANLMFESLFFLEHLKCTMVGLYDVLLVDKILTNGLYDSYSLEALMKRYRGYKSPKIPTLFGEENPEDLIKRLVAKKTEEWLLFHGWMNEDKEAEILEDAIEEVEGQFIDKSIRTQFVEIGDKPFTQQQIDYGEGDIIEPLELRNIFLRGRQIWNGKDYETYYPDSAIRMENKLITVLAEMLHHGIVFDAQAWLDVAKEKAKKYEEMRAFLDDYVVSNHPEFCGMLDLFTGNPSCSIDWQSSTQVKKLFNKLGLVVQARSKQTGKISDTVGAKDLIRSLLNEDKVRFQEGQFPEKIEKGSDLVVAYLLFKQTQQLITTYGKDFLNYLHPITKRIHCSIRQYLNTSRMAAVRPNQLAIPRGKEYRACYIAPKGSKVWACDYSSQETAVMAEVFRNKTLQKFFKDKVTDSSLDIHSWTATQMYKIIYNNPEFNCDRKVHKKERQNAKIVSFGLPYGMGDLALSQTLGISLDEAKEFIDMWFKSFPGMKEEFDKTKKQALELGWVRICEHTDKRYFFRDHHKLAKLLEQALSYYPEEYRKMNPEERSVFKQKLYEDYPEVRQIWREYASIKGTIERRSVNFRIQSASSTQTKASLIYMYDYRKANNSSWMPILPVHDELVGYSKEDKDIKIIHSLMIKGAQFVCKDTCMFAEIDSGDFWIH